MSSFLQYIIYASHFQRPAKLVLLQPRQLASHFSIPVLFLLTETKTGNEKN